MGSERPEDELVAELYADSSPMSSIANSVKRFTTDGIRGLYKEAKIYCKVLLPYYNERIHRKFRRCFYQLPATTFTGTAMLVVAPAAAAVDLVLGHSPAWSYVYLPATVVGFSLFIDFAFGAPFFDRFEWVRKDKERRKERIYRRRMKKLNY